MLTVSARVRPRAGGKATRADTRSGTDRRDGRHWKRIGMNSQVRAIDPEDSADAVQFAALCWRAGRKGAQVLLVTSRDTGRWVIPKGWPIKGLNGASTASREAWEEAGATGLVDEVPLGTFGYDKVLSRDRKTPPVLACRVEVFALRVADLAATFPEREQRRRKWFAPQAAARKVDEPELRALIAGFAPDL